MELKKVKMSKKLFESSGHFFGGERNSITLFALCPMPKCFYTVNIFQGGMRKELRKRIIEHRETGKRVLPVIRFGDDEGKW